MTEQLKLRKALEAIRDAYYTHGETAKEKFEDLKAIAFNILYEIDNGLEEVQGEEEQSFKSAEEIWYSRNPQHETNLDTGEDMFFRTAMMCMEEYAKQFKGEGEEDKINNLKNKI